jgi:hypothetical protein
MMREFRLRTRRLRTSAARPLLAALLSTFSFQFIRGGFVPNFSWYRPRASATALRASEGPRKASTTLTSLPSFLV